MFLPWFLNCLCFVQQLVEIKLNRTGQTPCLPSITIACFWIIHKKCFWYVKVSSEKQLWLENSKCCSEDTFSEHHTECDVYHIHSAQGVSNAETCRAELSNVVLLWDLLSPRRSGAFRRQIWTELDSGLQLLLFVCEISVVKGWSCVQRSCVACSLLCCMQVPRSKCPFWLQESKRCFCLYPFVLSMKRQNI